ncbi:MAG: LysR family transcriptional regulator [Proteobacteria bacterium]|nr:LysR family transcriptional regulator [Pseudomonadota bacterium]
MKRQKPKNPPVLKPRLRVIVGENIALGPGKVELLAAIAETGSIAEAAKRMEMSYMRAWTLVKQMEACFTEPILDRQRGGATRGGAQLTPTGRRVLELYYQMEAESLKATEKSWDELRKHLRS